MSNHEVERIILDSTQRLYYEEAKSARTFFDKFRLQNDN